MSESEQAKGTIEPKVIRNASEPEQAKGATEHEHVGNTSEPEQEKGTIGHVRNVSESEEEDSQIVEEAKARHLTPSSSASSSSSSSSSSSCASLEHDVPIAKSKSYGDLQLGQASVSMPNCPPQTPEWSMSSVSPIVGPEGHLSPTTSPPVQTMGHPSDYDPARIPASVFSSKPVNASDWSVASTDSLFSIHGGNTSFAKDQFRSEELARLEESSNGQSSLYASEAKPNEICSLPISLPPLMEVPSHEEGSVKSSNVSSLEKEDSITSGTMKGGRLSNESGTSSAFPALDSEGGRASSLEKVEEKPEVEAQDTNTRLDE
ncbi:hypothetical protein SASPL_142258 [Salvia splendens]|uniref:Uncharacterized protein n=1 Tax=Salvia splendens TaxID=180675 RepID=A0A8X8Z988_SALSN|nr:hypothetical protein SASPL_142258 [Salvia splendens]